MKGLAKAGKSRADFEAQAGTQVMITEDSGAAVQAALDRLKPNIALYVGGMGHRHKNFHKEMMVRRGFGEAAERIQELFLAKRKDEAAAAVPDEFRRSGCVGRPQGAHSPTVPRLGGRWPYRADDRRRRSGHRLRRRVRPAEHGTFRLTALAPSSLH